MPRPGRATNSIEVREVDRPRLVAMVSVYNSSQWLRDRLLNLLETSAYRNSEMLIFCVNAESPDQADDAICRDFANANANFRYETIPFCTVYAAWNWIISNTDSVFLTNANTDDLVSPHAYEVMMATCDQGDADLAYCGWHTIGDDVHHWSQIGGAGNDLCGYDPNCDRMSCGHFPLWRRSMHHRIGLFDPWFQALGDADFWYRAWVNGVRDFRRIDQPMGAYRWRFGKNLWHATADAQRAAEWAKLSSRQPGRLEF